MASVEQDFTPRLSGITVLSPERFSLSVSDRKFLIAAFAALIAVRLLAAMVFPYVDTTEARYGEIARIMLETGDWITPQFDYDIPFWGKPPLYTWLSAAGMAVFGVNEFGGRALILASAFGVLGIVHAWVRVNIGRDQALVALVVLFSSAMFLGASAFVMTDMVMTLGLTLGMVGFHNALLGRERHKLWFHLFFAGLAIGMLAKGPVAAVLAGLALFPWLVFTGHWRNLKHLPWPSGLLTMLLLTAPWYIAAELKTPGFLNYFLVGEHFERFIVSGWEGDLYGSGHARPFGIIWLYWVGTFLPWTPFIVPILWFRHRFGSAPRSSESGWEGYLVCWAIAPLVLFTPAANLLSAYVLPGLPATAVLLVTYWTRYCGRPGRWARVSFIVAIGSVLSLFAAVSVLLLAAPQTLRLKTERDLVAAAKAIEPAVEFTYWGSRSFSADFYSKGTATYTIRTADFTELLSNSNRDAIAVPEDELDELTPFLMDGYRNVGVFGRRALFIEKPNTEDGS